MTNLGGDPQTRAYYGTASAPPFGRHRRGVDGGAAPIESTLGAELLQQALLQGLPDARLGPIAQSPPARHATKSYVRCSQCLALPRKSPPYQTCHRWFRGWVLGQPLLLGQKLPGKQARSLTTASRLSVKRAFTMTGLLRNASPSCLGRSPPFETSCHTAPPPRRPRSLFSKLVARHHAAFIPFFFTHTTAPRGASSWVARALSTKSSISVRHIRL
jgi:hypothetical protein